MGRGGQQAVRTKDFPIYYINLQRRPDRRRHIQREIARVFPNSPVERVSALDGVAVAKLDKDAPYKKRNAAAAMGCRMSHYATLSRALKVGHGEVLILEDDAFFLEVEKLHGELHRADELVPDWEILALGGQHEKVKSSGVAGIERIEKLHGTSSYAVRGVRAMNRLRDAFKNGKDPADHVWMPVLQELNSYLFMPKLAGQLPGKSDIYLRKRPELF